jgi:hypothetical protein
VKIREAGAAGAGVMPGFMDGAVTCHVILVDDLEFVGTPGYPAAEELAPPGYSFDAVGSVARLAPVTRS